MNSACLSDALALLAEDARAALAIIDKINEAKKPKQMPYPEMLGKINDVMNRMDYLICAGSLKRMNPENIKPIYEACLNLEAALLSA